MSQHLETLIDAYLDGELTDRQVNKMEIHLEKCPQCQTILEKRRHFSNLLQAVPSVGDLKNSEQFVAEVNLLLPRQQKTQKNNFINFVWILIPLVLLAAYVFIQALTLISIAFSLFPGANDLFVNAFTGANAGLNIFPWLQTVIEGAMIWTGVDWLFQWNLLTYIFSLLILGVLYCLWLAGWWVSNHQMKPQKS